MPNGSDTERDELEIDTLEDESDVDTQDTSHEEGEGEFQESDLDDSLESEEDTSVPQQKPQASDAALAQENAWYSKIVTGKTSLEDPRLPSWLRPKLEKRLGVSEPPKQENIKKIIEEEIRFTDLKKSIPKLTKKQAEELKAKYAEFKPLGKVKALETAIELLGLSKRMQEAERRGLAKGRMSLPPSGQPSEKNQDDILALAKDPKKWKAFIKGQK
jgi:hypothetical protein